MTQTTETLPISLTRVQDIAHQIVAQLGGWRYHPGLSATANTHLVNGPSVTVHLHTEETDEQAAFLDDLAVVLDTVVRVSPTWVGTVATGDYRSTGVTVQAQGRVA